MLGRSDGVAERGIHHNDAARRRSRDIDVVDADAGPADNFQAFGLFQQLGGNFSRGPNRQTIEAVDYFGELVFVLAKAGLEIDINAAILKI
jgi:hypothetical protein